MVVTTRGQQAANMAAAGDPMAGLVAQVAALTAALQPGVTATTAATYARTPALMGQSNLLEFRKKVDPSVYAEGKNPIF